MAGPNEADAVFEFTFHVDPGTGPSKTPSDLDQKLESVIKSADLVEVKNQFIKATRISGTPKLVSTSPAPLTARIDIELEPHSLADYSLADAQAKLNEVQIVIGEYLTYLLRVELDRMGFEKSAKVTFDHGFVHSYGLRWKEPGLSRYYVPIGLSFSIGLVCGAGLVYILQ